MLASFQHDSAAAGELMAKHAAEIEELADRTKALIAEEPELMSAPAVVEAMGRFFPGADDDGVQGGDDGADGHSGGGGHDEPAPAPDADRPKLTEEDKALLDDMLVVQERVVEILAANMNDPDKAAAELMKLADEQREPLARFVEVQQRLEGDQEAAAEFAQKHMARIVAIGEKLTEVIRANPALATHEKVQAAMARLNGAP